MTGVVSGGWAVLPTAGRAAVELRGGRELVCRGACWPPTVACGVGWLAGMAELVPATQSDSFWAASDIQNARKSPAAKCHHGHRRSHADPCFDGIVDARIRRTGCRFAKGKHARLCTQTVSQAAVPAPFALPW